MKSARELQALVDDLRSLRRLIDESQREAEMIKAAIKSHMEEAGADELAGANYAITWKKVTSSRFDKSAMIRTFGRECYDSFCKPVTSRRFVLSA